MRTRSCWHRQVFGFSFGWTTCSSYLVCIYELFGGKTTHGLSRKRNLVNILLLLPMTIYLLLRHRSAASYSFEMSTSSVCDRSAQIS
ncbi:hypothetical protein HDV64DRAFT_63219 [Trichoderma sp. TUCIM 5745]